MSALGWQRRLDQASTREAVVEIVNDFLALWTHAEIVQLPHDCAPGNMDNADQVSDYALKLARRHTIGVGDLSGMHRMATFFTKAALRIFQIDEALPRTRSSKHEGGRAP